MSRRVVLLSIFALAFVVFTNTCFARTWTDRKGREVDADFVVFADGNVSVKRKSDGKIFHVPLELLSDADQAFVKSQLKQPAPNIEVTTPEVKGALVVDKSEEWKTSEDEFLLHLRCKVTTRQRRITMGAAKGKLKDSDLAAFSDFKLTLPSKTTVTAVGLGHSIVGDLTLCRAPNGYENLINLNSLERYVWDVDVLFVIPKDTRSAVFRFGEGQPVPITIPAVDSRWRDQRVTTP